MVFKCTQYVEPNKVGCWWPTKRKAFVQAQRKLSCIFSQLCLYKAAQFNNNDNDNDKNNDNDNDNNKDKDKYKDKEFYWAHQNSSLGLHMIIIYSSKQ